MKKLIKYLPLPVAAAVLFAVIFYIPSFAETVTATSIEQQVGRLATALDGLLIQKKQPAMSQTISFSQGVNNPTCLDNFFTWKTSGTYKNNAKWNVDFMPFINSGANMPGTMSRESFADLNGDGLPDYIYLERSPYLSGSGTIIGGSCVYLNNGSGFNLTYRCYVDGNSPNQYHGDCAG